MALGWRLQEVLVVPVQRLDVHREAGEHDEA
jgi:hypothetical protein